MKSMARIAVVIPVYNAEGCLNELLSRLTAVLKKITPSFEIIFVEDHSHDRSWQIIEGFASTESRVCGLHLTRNFGQHAAIAAGLDHCDGDWVIIMDCDLQDAPEDIERLYRAAQDGHDIVLTQRLRRRASWFRTLLGKSFASVFGYLTERNFDVRVGAFRILSRRVVEAYREMNEKNPYLPGAIGWLGFPTTSIEVEQNERFAGESGYTLGKLLRLAVFSVVSYSDKPLRLTVKFGLAFAAISCFFGIALIFDHLLGAQRLPGWSSIIVSIYLVGGLLMATIGMVGLYVGKLFDLARNRPPYIISSATTNGRKLKYYFGRAGCQDRPIGATNPFGQIGPGNRQTGS
jgi:polyisoprenyl-phosphate glycosyltransferase